MRHFKVEAEANKVLVVVVVCSLSSYSPSFLLFCFGRPSQVPMGTVTMTVNMTYAGEASAQEQPLCAIVQAGPFKLQGPEQASA